MDHLISMYIDNELSLSEKILFVEHVHNSKPYKEDAVDLLEQEKLLSSSLNRTAPAVDLKVSRPGIIPALNRPLGWAAAACLLVLLSFIVKQNFTPQIQSQSQQGDTVAAVRHRFVIHHPHTHLVEIAGSFTNWQNVSLLPIGTSGYWEVELELPAGEHRYIFIIDGSKYLPDPTAPNQELDDFGSTNSILNVEA